MSENAAPNPNKSNQFKTDPRQQLCWSYYIDPNSPTFGNAASSARKAGYEPKSARQVTTQQWFISLYNRHNRLEKAEKVFDKILKMDTDDSSILRIQLDASKFVAEKTGGKNWNPVKEIDIKSDGEKVTGFNYILPEDLTK